MADKINEIHETLNQLLKDIPNSENLAMKIAEKHYYIEVQLSQDYEQIKNRIMHELSEMNKNNIELKKLTIEAILLVVQKQFEERKIEALECYKYTTERL